MAPELSAVIPTLGWSGLLADALAHLRRDGGEGLEIVVVWQGTGAPPPLPEADHVLTAPGRLGFSRATNLGIAESRGRYVATVNDDVLVEPGWAAALVAVLDGAPRAAAAQGVNLLLDSPALADGCGVGWNRAWQAVQLGHGRPAPAAAEPPREVFGVSATAAVYRRRALDAAHLTAGGPFDPRLGSYYEDVDLACRLRAGGATAFLVPAARARHAGSATGERLGRRRLAWIYGNRLLVLARLLGRRFWGALPGALGRDARDLATAARGLDGARCAGILGGWARAARHLPAYAHRGAPALAPAELAAWRAGSGVSSPE